MSRFIFLLTGFFFSLTIYANECQQPANLLTASYTITTTTEKGTQVSRQLELWRQPNAVLHRYPTTEITEGWEHVHNKIIKPTRYFDHYQRAIEYQPGERVHGKQDTDWSYRNQLISDAMLAIMTRTNQQGQGCDATETYALTDTRQELTLVWLPALQLVKSFHIKTPHKIIDWQQTELTFNETAIKQKFAMLSNYQSTDFADIGDDHTDPFLTKMVHQGFLEAGASGYYDTKGNAIGSHHH
jgi:hypothetical protein